MRERWLTIVLLLTNRIYAKKQQVIRDAGLKTVVGVFSLLFLEICLAIISIPLYVNTKSKDTVAYMEEKGTYQKITVDYNLRRILTLTGLGIILAIWALKLLLILAVPSIYGPLNLYRITNVRPADLLNKEQIVNETAIQTAAIDKTVPKPTLDYAKKNSKSNLVFYGTAQPLRDIVLLLADQHVAVYYGASDKKGKWEIEHSQQNFKVSDGNHSVLVYSHNKDAGTRSELSDEQFIKTTSSWVDVLVRNVDTLTNWSVAIIILFGAFLTLLTL